MSPTSVQDADREQTRLEALRSYGILDTPPEPQFDRLVQRAARECGYPVAMLTMMDAERCWFKATTGLSVAAQQTRQLPREQTFCNYAFRSSGIFVVPDAKADERFSKLRIVDRPGGFRAYAGAQLITPAGHSIGTLCILDENPRELAAEQRAALGRLATDAMALLESRRRRDDAPAPPVKFAASALRARDIVLLVDDEELVRTFIGHVLERRGVEFITAENGTDALAKYRVHAEKVGLVLTDIHMPVMDGYSLIRALQQEPNPPSIAVMSGRLDARMRAELAAMGISRALGKPFRIDEIVALLPA